MKELGLAFLMAACLFDLSPQTLTIFGENLPPSIFLDADGNPSGYAVEAVRDIMLRIGDTTPIKILPWPYIYREIQEKDNIAVFLMSRTKARENLFKWVGPINTSTVVLVGKTGARTLFGTIEAAKNAPSIGVVKEDAKNALLKNMGFANLVESPTGEISLKNMAVGRTALAVSTGMTWRKTLRSAGMDPDAYEEVLELDEMCYYIAFSKNVPDTLISKWQRAYEASVTDGTLQRILDKWIEGTKVGKPWK